MLILEKRHSRLGFEEGLLLKVAQAYNCPVKFVVEKEASRGRIDFTNCVLAAGSVTFMKHVLRNHGRELPVENSYPDCLRHLLYRDVKKLRTLKEAKSFLDKGHPFFIKPADLKRFTGFVTWESDDFRFMGVSNQIPVWVSTPVKFVSEWRCYVADGKLLDIRFADLGGDRTVLPNRMVIEDAVQLLTASGAPAGYAVDFGVLDSGETALVELNDGFSIGAYDGIDAETYWNVVHSRWQELIR